MPTVITTNGNRLSPGGCRAIRIAMAFASPPLCAAGHVAQDARPQPFCQPDLFRVAESAHVAGRHSCRHSRIHFWMAVPEQVRAYPHDAHVNESRPLRSQTRQPLARENKLATVCGRNISPAWKATYCLVDQLLRSQP